MTPGTTRAARAAGTRSHLVAVGRELFAERGFAATSTEELVARAGVTRGALYHHFAGKQELFRAVFAEISEEVFERVNAAAMADGEPWPGLVAGCAAYLDAALDPAVQRIALVDAPSVLGWQEWREVGAGNLFGLLATGLHWVAATGEMPDQPVAPLAHLLLGALNEGALYIAGAADRRAARDEVAGVVARFLAGVRTRGPD
ncbi:MAG TPA: TetR/AcrR family transcriptional regulator [Acidimicrobiales bacterium]|nr:TetR/AcrR family transcriptional regulator [Acidimicrobiales bacterium]